jgi:hypothetical protein
MSLWAPFTMSLWAPPLWGPPAVEQRALGRRQGPGLLHHLCERLFDCEHECAFRGAIPPVLGQRPRDNAHCSRKFLSSLIPSRVRKLSG